MRVKCLVENTTLRDLEGENVDAIVAECRKCGHETESFGRTEGSILRCLALMREDCPLGEKNFYVDEDD